jgi:hypothetical protein
VEGASSVVLRVQCYSTGVLLFVSLLWRAGVFLMLPPYHGA